MRNHRRPESKDVTDSSFVVRHMRCNVSFPNKQPLLLQVGGSSSAEVKAPVQHRGCWKHTTAPLFGEFLLQWTRFGLRLLFSFSLLLLGQFFFFFFHPLLSSYSSLDFIAHTLGDDFVNETMHILAAFMMVMTSSGGTMEGERWHSGVMVVGNGGGARECLFVCRWWVKKLISPCQLRNNLCFFLL